MTLVRDIVLNNDFKNQNCLEFVLAVGLRLNFECGVKKMSSFFKRQKNSIGKIRLMLKNCEEMQPVENPVDMCVVLMSAKSRRCHVGFMHNGIVVHKESKRPIMFHSIESLKKHGYFLEGFYV